MNILSLDLGTTTGWARLSGGAITSGSEKMKKRTAENDGMRYINFIKFLVEQRNAPGGVDMIVYELVRRHAGTQAAHTYGGFKAHLMAFCAKHDIPCKGFEVAEIKKHATGKGNAPKQAMIAAARARGFSPADDNEADALAILHWALETRGGVR